MSLRSQWVAVVLASTLAAVLAFVPVAAHGSHPSNYLFATPVFGIDTAFDGSLLVADAGAGIVRLRHNRGTLIAKLPGVTDVAPAWFGLLAVTGGTTAPGPPPPLARKLFRVVRGEVTQLADLEAFEKSVNPDGGVIESNPFDVAALWNGSALVADAAANALLIVDHKGRVDWVATLPTEAVPTDNLKQLVGCPAAPPEFLSFCELPPMMPAEGVATSVAVGPDGAYYVGELKGFPAPTGESRIWRIKPHARHAQCGTSPDCRVIADGFTSIVDLSFGLDGTLHVVELDEASWFAIELASMPNIVVPGRPVGGTVSACTRQRWTGSWMCDIEAAGLLMPTAATVDFRGNVHVVTNALVPGAAEVITLR
jgi:hypothetical protein